MSTPVTRPLMRLLARAVVRLLTHTTVSGAERLPTAGPLVVVFNHLGHLDALVLIASLPYDIQAIALSDLLNVPVTGFMLRLYGVIPVQRDQTDRAVVKRSLAVLSNGGVLVLAPEARMSVSGALERARDGAAYLALRAKAPLLPVGLTGTENDAVYGAWTRCRRPRITVSIGEPFTLPALPLDAPQRRQSLEHASTQIMTRLARLLPVQYQGVYAEAAELAQASEYATALGEAAP